jgi:hypothetical protein
MTRHGGLSAFGALLLVALTIVTDGKLELRRHHRAAPGAKPHRQAADKTSRFGKLLDDVDQSIRKSGREADSVFAQLYGYDNELETSLGREIGLLNNTRHRLTALQEKFRVKSKRSEMELQQLGFALKHSQKTESKYEATSVETDKKFDSLLSKAQRLMGVLRTAAGSPAMEVDQKDIKSLRAILKMHGELQHQFSDVFNALSVGQPDAKEAPQLTGHLLTRSVAALQTITSRLHKRRSGVLLQLQNREQELSGVEAKAAQQTDAAQGAEEETDQKAEELAFSVSFTDSVLQGDATFLAKVQKHIRAKNTLVDNIRATRKKQTSTIEDLVDLLKGKFTVNQDAPGVSLLQEEDGNTALQTQIEAAIRHRANTHGILMRVKAVLDNAAPIDTDSVRDVMTKMGSALRAVDTEDASADDAKRECEQQQFRAGQEYSQLQRSLANMRVSKNHTEAALKATKKNLEGIASKSQTLKKSSAQFGRMANGAIRTISGQGHDRGMIMAALHKAQDLVPNQGLDERGAQAADALLGQLMSLLESQDKSEHTYKAQQEALRSDLNEYTSDYEQLLSERRVHYERTLSALELYSSELSGDTAARIDSLQDEDELKAEGGDLCSSIMAFYKKHSERRVELSSALRAALPKLPEILMRKNAPAGGDAPAEAETEAVEA